MKRLRMTLASLIMVASFCMLAGCASTGESKPEPESTEAATENTLYVEPEDLEIIESGWSVGEHGYVNYGVGISNPNDGFEAQQVKLTTTGRDAEGKIVFTQDDYIPFILPGGTSYIGGQAGRETPPDTIEFSVTVDDRHWVKSDHVSSAIFEIANPNEIASEYAHTYTGELSANLNWDDIGSARLCVLLRDESGAIIYGSMSYVDYPAEGQTVPFEIHAPDVPEHATYELNAIPAW